MQKNRKEIIITILIILLVIIILKINKKSKTGIIPKPAKIFEKSDDFFTINESTVILYDQNNSEIKRLSEHFSRIFFLPSGINMAVKKNKNNRKIYNKIIFTLRNMSNKLGKEGYELTVSHDYIKVSAKESAGIFYGIQTLKQLLPDQIESRLQTSDEILWKIPALRIIDYPAYKWRGMMLDSCRHFMPVSFIKKFIDYLAMYKLNKFHWHLTDDQGWRIEIKKYPELSRIGAWRKETVIGHSRDIPVKYDGRRHGGIYTQSEIKEIIKYAKERYVTVIPEIEMPGHATAALATFPELSCTGGQFEVGTTWGIYEDVYCAGKEKTFKFIEDVLSEVIALFPSEYIHIGGDECPKVRWEECPDCQARIKEEKLKDEKELQSYFIKRIEKFLNSKGKKLIGWDEILEGGLAPDATVMSWRGTEGGIIAAKSGHDVIMTPTSHCYFDYYQDKPEREPLAIGGLLTLKKVYTFKPTPGILTPKEKKHILGGQANLWTEYIPNPKQAEYMIFPRIAALSEIVWTPKKSIKWKDFYKRVKKQYNRYRIMGINYHMR